MWTRRLFLALGLAVVSALAWALMRRSAPPSRDPQTAGVIRGAAGFLAVLFLLKIAPLIQQPEGLLREDFLFPLWALWRRGGGWWWFFPAVAGFVAAWAAWTTGRLRRLPTWAK